MSKIEFKNRVAIVTGAGRGIGRDYAIELAKRGAKVVVNDFGGTRDGQSNDASPADEVVDVIKSFGGEAAANYDNVATREGGENIVKTALDAFGTVDILINNAGILRDKSFVKMDEETWDAVVNVHLKGSYYVTRPAFIVMKEKKYGRIVMTASASGIFGTFGQTNYSAAKMGIMGLTNTLRLEGAKNNILVNVILPGAGTRLTNDVLPPELYEKMGVEYITPAVLCMCSDKFTDTGLYINAMGGYFSRSAIMTNYGATFEKLPSPEEVMGKWADIKDLKETIYYNDSGEQIQRIFGDGLVRPD
jgi:NAD(P)-dependent dehydrogenase (short-subunit alcohol dehydrogenase family)